MFCNFASECRTVQEATHYGCWLIEEGQIVELIPIWMHVDVSAEPTYQQAVTMLQSVGLGTVRNMLLESYVVQPSCVCAGSLFFSEFIKLYRFNARSTSWKLKLKLFKGFCVAVVASTQMPLIRVLQVVMQRTLSNVS